MIGIAENMKRFYDLCPDCHINWVFAVPARVDERKPDGEFGPSDYVRCVECKGVFLMPLKTD